MSAAALADFAKQFVEHSGPKMTLVEHVCDDFIKSKWSVAFKAFVTAKLQEQMKQKMQQNPQALQPQQALQMLNNHAAKLFEGLIDRSNQQNMLQPFLILMGKHAFTLFKAHTRNANNMVQIRFMLGAQKVITCKDFLVLLSNSLVFRVAIMQQLKQFMLPKVVFDMQLTPLSGPASIVFTNHKVCFRLTFFFSLYHEVVSYSSISFCIFIEIALSEFRI